VKKQWITLLLTVLVLLRWVSDTCTGVHRGFKVVLLILEQGGKLRDKGGFGFF